MTDAWTLTLCFATGGVVLIVVSAFWRARHSQVTDSTIEAFRILGVEFSSIVGAAGVASALPWWGLPEVAWW